MLLLLLFLFNSVSDKQKREISSEACKELGDRTMTKEHTAEYWKSSKRIQCNKMKKVERKKCYVSLEESCLTSNGIIKTIEIKYQWTSYKNW